MRTKQWLWETGWRSGDHRSATEWGRQWELRAVIQVVIVISIEHGAPLGSYTLSREGKNVEL